MMSGGRLLVKFVKSPSNHKYVLTGTSGDYSLLDSSCIV